MNVIRRGSLVTSPVGSGVVTDMAYGEALVRLDEGSEFDTSHGRWWNLDHLTVVGHDPDAIVWLGSHMRAAGE